MVLIFLQIALAVIGIGFITLLYFITVKNNLWKGIEVLFVCFIAAAIFFIAAMALAIKGAWG